LQKKGFSIPDRVKIIGINNDLISRNCHPTLTTIAIDYQKQAETAMRRMMSVLGEVDEKCGQSEIVIPMTVIEREST
jgi:DNA-binding LacI/PurR family transcriptional regulator